MKNFVVVRIANKADGTASIPVSAYETEVEAWKSFYRNCGVAVDSEHPLDAVCLLSKEGFMLEYKPFYHEVPEPEPEPEPEGGSEDEPEGGSEDEPEGGSGE